MNPRPLPKRVVASMLLAAELRPGRSAAADRECFEEASWLAKKTGGKLHLVHVLDESRFPAEITREDIARARKSALTRLTAYADGAVADGIETTWEVRSGFPWIEIIRAAREKSADLIVVGSRRTPARFFANAVFGSTARRLMRKSEIPVWVARDTGDPPITAVAVAVDLNLPMSARLLEQGEALRQAFGARAFAFHSLPYELAYYSIGAAAAEGTAVAGPRAEEIDGARAEIAAILGEAAKHWDIRVGEGPVVADVARLVERDGVDLLVMGSVSRSGIPGLIVGNTAETVFARVDCPLWVLKPEGWVSPVPVETGDAS